MAKGRDMVADGMGETNSEEACFRGSQGTNGGEARGGALSRAIRAQKECT